MYHRTVFNILNLLVIVGLLLNSCNAKGHYENVALNKKCRISSNYNETLDKADRAVNGNKRGVYTPGVNCIHTQGALHNWWEVDLGQTYPVYSITIWAREKRFVERMSRCVITVDGQTCYSFRYVPVTTNREIHINCSQGILNGRIIRVEKNSTEDHREKAMNFCEFEVFSCSRGYWGSNCDKQCTGICRNNDACNPVTGHCNSCQNPGWDPVQDCVKYCPEGTFGQDCAHNCSENCASKCDPVTGSCTCKPGWKTNMCVEECANGTYGQDCAQFCSEHCQDVCDKETGNCTCSPGWLAPICKEKCENGTYGANCSQTCGRCRGGAACDNVNGTCSECDGALQPPLCSSCLGGVYGIYCNKPCSKNCRNPCDAITGHCTCKPGWKRPNCTEKCEEGYYGQDCLEPCSKNCDGPCDNVAGNCTCKPGWKFPLCNQLCPLNTYGVNCTGRCGACFANAYCDRVNGYCSSCMSNFVMPYCTGTDCLAGKYGKNCEQTCGNCTEGTKCHPLTGHCTCSPGWKPPLCQQACDYGHYGVNCTETCGRCYKNQTCDPDTGHCSACDHRKMAMPFCQECVTGHWGVNCTLPCGHCAGNGACERGTGNCLHFCQTGWTGGIRCDKQCEDGWYGINCSLQCGRCRGDAPCRHDNGFCEACEDGFDGYLCQRAGSGALYSKAEIGAIAGSVVAAGVLIAVAVVVGAWWIRRRRDRNTEEQHDIGLYNRSNSQKSDQPSIRKTIRSVASENSYIQKDKITFDDLGRRVPNPHDMKPLEEMEYLY